jgi:serine/threonine protein kinase
MSESLGPGSTFAGCKIEAVAGRGGMGVVFRATQLALRRSVALKAIAPELAADLDFRERFQRESQLAASIDHRNVIPVYEAGELDGTLYLIMRWVDGTDLRTALARSGRLSPKRAIALLRPVASALAAAHRRGLVHRDVKPANVLVARADEGDDEHVYLTDFGIARRADSESVTRTGIFVGTVDYTAPERFQGGKGDAASDIYSLGCVLFETLTGHIPYDRPSGVAKIYAHVTDPVPSARAEVRDVPEELDAIVARAMAKEPRDRFASASELAAALGEVLSALETTERTAPPAAVPTVLEPGAPTVMSSEPATRIEPPDPATRTEPPEPATRTEPPEPATRTEATEPPAAAEAPTVGAPPGAERPRRRRSPFLWLAPVLVLTLAGVLIATFSDNPGGGAGSTQTGGAVSLHGGGLTLGRTINLPGTPGSVSIGKRNVWVSIPGAGKLVRSKLTSGATSVFAATGQPGALVAGTKALWVAQSGSGSLAQFNGDAGTQAHGTKLSGNPVALALDPADSTVWVADSSGAVTHVAVGGTTVGAPVRVNPPPTGLALGEGWLWAVNGAADGLVRISPGSGGAPSTFAAGEHPLAATLDQGVWVANGNGDVTRFDPRTGHLGVNADLRVAPELDAIAAVDPSPVVWAISKRTKTLYRITNATLPAVTGTAVFSSAPIALAVSAHAVWVATQDGKAIQIGY